MTDSRTTARLALACLDLTSLNDADTEADVARLCDRAQGPHGPVAAVCVWPRFAAFARRTLPPHIAVAAVANFPDGSADIERALRDTGEIVQGGAQEVDVVLPFASLQRGDVAAASSLLDAVRKASHGLVLKVILESGVLVDDTSIALASRVAIDAGADFLKTSTGKTATSATPAAARRMLQSIASMPMAAARVGFKVSGGVRSVGDAAAYIALCGELLGVSALQPRRFRIGASSLLNDIESVLRGGASPSSTATDANVPTAPGSTPTGSY